ncbi:GPI ethanolamine phosphate transferase 3 [Entamoeba marina]
MKDLPFYLIIFSLSLTSLYLFASGFFLTSVPLSQSSQCNDTQFTNTLYASTYDLKCWSQPLFKRAVYLFIDALRYDFAYSTPDETPYHGKMKHMRTMGEPIHTKRYHYTAHYPTTTAQRLKGLTCGIVPSFVEAADTFNSPVIVEDSYVKQYHENGVKFNVVGNILWKNSFTTLLNDIKTGPSLDVTDRDSIDFQCASELKNQMKEGVNDVVLFHTLGLDHNGHYHRKIRHEEMYKKLEWQDEFIYNASKLVGDDTLFIVGGDHGLTEDGNHGGCSKEETDAALLIYSPHGLSEMMKGVNEIMQVDLVPTMSLIMGVPVPFGNIGAPIRPIFLGNSPQLKDYHHFVNALNVTGIQIIRYLQTYSKVNHRTVSWLPDIQERLKYVVNEEVNHFGDINKLENLVDIHEQILHEIEKTFVEENATYKKPLMIYSLLILSIVLVICILYTLDIQYIKTSHEFHIVIVLSIASTCILLLFEIVSDIIQATLCSCALFIALQICFGFLPNFFNAFKLLEIEQMISFSLIIVYCIWIAVQENSDSFYEEELSEGYTVMQFSFALICLFLYKNRPSKQIQNTPNGIEIEINDLEESSSNIYDSIVTNTTPSKKNSILLC